MLNVAAEIQQLAYAGEVRDSTCCARDDVAFGDRVEQNRQRGQAARDAAFTID